MKKMIQLAAARSFIFHITQIHIFAPCIFRYEQKKKWRAPHRMWQITALEAVHEFSVELSWKFNNPVGYILHICIHFVWCSVPQRYYGFMAFTNLIISCGCAQFVRIKWISFSLLLMLNFSTNFYHTKYVGNKMHSTAVRTRKKKKRNK